MELKKKLQAVKATPHSVVESESLTRKVIAAVQKAAELSSAAGTAAVAAAAAPSATNTVTYELYYGSGRSGGSSAELDARLAALEQRVGFAKVLIRNTARNFKLMCCAGCTGICGGASFPDRVEGACI